MSKVGDSCADDHSAYCQVQGFRYSTDEEEEKEAARLNRGNEGEGSYLAGYTAAEIGSNPGESDFVRSFSHFFFFFFLPLCPSANYFARNRLETKKPPTFPWGRGAASRAFRNGFAISITRYLSSYIHARTMRRRRIAFRAVALFLKVF